jgi:hypothetical protein
VANEGVRGDRIPRRRRPIPLATVRVPGVKIPWRVSRPFLSVVPAVQVPDTPRWVRSLSPRTRLFLKTQGALPTEDAALVLLFGLVVSGQCRVRSPAAVRTAICDIRLWRSTATCVPGLLSQSTLAGSEFPAYSGLGRRPTHLWHQECGIYPLDSPHL